MGKPRYKDEAAVRELHAEYERDKLTLDQLGERYGLDGCRAAQAFRRLGLPVRGNSAYRTTTPDDDFFSDIRTEAQAYLLGFFASDGHLEFRDYGSYALKWDIQERDVELLHLVNQYIGKNTYNVYKCKDRPIVGIAITSKKLGESLRALGYDNHKTRTCKSLPKLPEELMHHFLRGYFDGDGSVGINRAGQGYNRFFAIASFSVEVLHQIAEILPHEFSLRIWPSSHQINGKGPVVESHTLSYNSRRDLELIYEYLYKDATLFLRRKKDKFEVAIKTAKQIAASGGNLCRTPGELLETP